MPKIRQAFPPTIKFLSSCDIRTDVTSRKLIPNSLFDGSRDPFS